MKIEELRIGNYYDNNGFIEKVTPNTIIEVWESERSWCKPIPLTEEALLKLGLKDCGYKQMYGQEFYKDGLSIYLEGGEFRFYTSTNRVYTSYDSVHEIQNLFHALGCGLLTLN